MAEKYSNKMYRVEYTIGGWGPHACPEGFKEMKCHLLPLSASSEEARKTEAMAKLARLHGQTIRIHMVREVIS